MIARCPEYEINRVGDIRRSADGKQVKAKAQKRIYGGYVRAGLCSAGGFVSLDIHRAVAAAFLPNPENKPHVHHIDGDKRNNCADNLMWVTREEHGKLHRK